MQSLECGRVRFFRDHHCLPSPRRMLTTNSIAAKSPSVVESSGTFTFEINVKICSNGSSIGQRRLGKGVAAP